MMAKEISKEEIEEEIERIKNAEEEAEMIIKNAKEKSEKILSELPKKI